MEGNVPAGTSQTESVEETVYARLFPWPNSHWMLSTPISPCTEMQSGLRTETESPSQRAKLTIFFPRKWMIEPPPKTKLEGRKPFADGGGNTTVCCHKVCGFCKPYTPLMATACGSSDPFLVRFLARLDKEMSTHHKTEFNQLQLAQRLIHDVEQQHTCRRQILSV